MVYMMKISKKELIDAISKLKFVKLTVKAHPRGMFSPLHVEYQSKLNSQRFRKFLLQIFYLQRKL